MKKFLNLYVILGLVCLVSFFLLIVLLSFDKGYVGMNEVGLSSLNGLISYKYNKSIDIATDIILYLSLAFAAAMAILGLYQLIKRKSLFKVDIDIIVFGVFLVIMVILWLLFGAVITVNKRPIKEDVASFPSTHIMVSTFIYLAAHGIICVRNFNNKYKYISLASSALMVMLISVLRVASGLHYITDALGGVLMGVSLYFLTFGVIKALKGDKNEKTNNI